MKYSIHFISLFLIGISTLLITSCGESTQENNDNADKNAEYVPNKDEIAFEEKMRAIDQNETFAKATSLFYSRADGASVDVEMFLDSTNTAVKIVEKYTESATQSICSNTFYLVEGKKFATRELFEYSKGDSSSFSERITYYDKKEKPVATKIRTATYEDGLEFESFQLTEKKNCSMDRAISVLNQTDNYATRFRGFVKEDPYLYIIVGENDKNGYSSSLVVQMMTSTIKQLQENELAMIGKPLKINFETLDDEQGFVYQILMEAEIR